MVILVAHKSMHQLSASSYFAVQVAAGASTRRCGEVPVIASGKAGEVIFKCPESVPPSTGCD
eukprot:6209377-Pleurochrysis_carterae.AAC.1